MVHHITWAPASGQRQVNVRYQVGDPNASDIEKLRALSPYKSLNAIMMEAMLIGARHLLLSIENSPESRLILPNVGKVFFMTGPQGHSELINSVDLVAPVNQVISGTDRSNTTVKFGGHALNSSQSIVAVPVKNKLPVIVEKVEISSSSEPSSKTAVFSEKTKKHLASW